MIIDNWLTSEASHRTTRIALTGISEKWDIFNKSSAYLCIWNATISTTTLGPYQGFYRPIWPSKLPVVTHKLKTITRSLLPMVQLPVEAYLVESLEILSFQNHWLNRRDRKLVTEYQFVEANLCQIGKLVRGVESVERQARNRWEIWVWVGKYHFWSFQNSKLKSEISEIVLKESFKIGKMCGHAELETLPKCSMTASTSLTWVNLSFFALLKLELRCPIVIMSCLDLKLSVQCAAVTTYWSLFSFFSI